MPSLSSGTAPRGDLDLSAARIRELRPAGRGRVLVAVDCPFRCRTGVHFRLWVLGRDQAVTCQSTGRQFRVVR